MLLAGSLPAGFNLEVTFLWQYSTSGLTGCILCPHKVQGKARELLAWHHMGSQEKAGLAVSHRLVAAPAP